MKQELFRWEKDLAVTIENGTYHLRKYTRNEMIRNLLADFHLSRDSMINDHEKFNRKSENFYSTLQKRRFFDKQKGSLLFSVFKRGYCVEYS